jgi:cytochrome c553
MIDRKSDKERGARCVLACLGALCLLVGCGREETTPKADARREIETALSLTPNTENGLRIYRACAECHQPEGWGLADGSVPQLAGQHRKVIIKQLAENRSGHRDNPKMFPFASEAGLGGAQGVSDVAGYIDTLEISAATGKGKGDDLELGKKLYATNCVRCHGAEGEGDNDSYIPRIQSQHYAYLVRQFEVIQHGMRGNANPDMVAQIRDFTDPEIGAVLDYTSRLEPPEELQAPPNWKNPDFMD